MKDELVNWYQVIYCLSNIIARIHLALSLPNVICLARHCYQYFSHNRCNSWLIWLVSILTSCCDFLWKRDKGILICGHITCIILWHGNSKHNLKTNTYRVQYIVCWWRLALDCFYKICCVGLCIVGVSNWDEPGMHHDYVYMLQ